MVAQEGWTSLFVKKEAKEELDSVIPIIQKSNPFVTSYWEVITYLVRFYKQKCGKVEESSPQSLKFD